MSNGSEWAIIGALLLAILKLNFDKESEELFSFDLRQFDVTGHFSVDKELVAEKVGERLKKSNWPWSQEFFKFLFIVNQFLLVIMSIKSSIKFLKHLLERRDTVQEALRDKNSAVIVSLLRSIANDITNATDNLL